MELGFLLHGEINVGVGLWEALLQHLAGRFANGKPPNGKLK